MRCVCFIGMLVSCYYLLKQLCKMITKDSSKWLATCDAMCWFSWVAMIFCNNFARGLQKIVATCDAMCLFYWDASIMLLSFETTKIVASQKNPTYRITCCYSATIFCNHLAKLLQKIIASRPSATHPIFGTNLHFQTTRQNQSTESPILFRSCGHETPFYDQKGASQIGDSVLWSKLSTTNSGWNFGANVWNGDSFQKGWVADGCSIP